MEYELATYHYPSGNLVMLVKEDMMVKALTSMKSYSVHDEVVMVVAIQEVVVLWGSELVARLEVFQSFPLVN